MKRLFKRKRFWLAVAIIVVGGIFVWFKFFTNQTTVIYTTETVKLGDLVQTVSATGKVDPADDIELNFKSTGRLVYQPVKEGSQVKAGDVLARLDTAGISAQVEQYQASLAAAQADLSRVRSGASSEDVKVSAEQVTKAENDLATLLVKRDDELKTLREKNLDALSNANYTARVALNKVYNYFINSSNIANLQVSNNNLKNQIDNDYYSLKLDFDNKQASIDSANSQKTAEAIIAASDKMRSTLSALNILLDNSFTLADAIMINTAYSQATKDAIKTDLDAQQSASNTALSSLQTAKSNLTNTTAGYESQIQAGQNSLSIYRAQLALKQAGPRDFELAAAEAKVAQARAQLNQALAGLSDNSIIAPIDGLITKVNYSLGEQTGLATPAVKMLGNEKFEINVDIPESDIAKIKVGDKVVIELDAFGSDHPFSGAITFIDPAQTVIQDVTYYKTTVGFDKDSWNDQIKPGMTADVTVTTAQKTGVLYIPQRAVKLKETVLGAVPVKYVQILTGGQTQERTVEVGLRGDNGLVEVLSGLSEGEQVVTFQK